MSGRVLQTLPALENIWVYLSGTPLMSLILTLAAYQAGLWLHERSGRHPVVNPVALAVVFVASTLLLTDLPYRTYFQGAQFIHFMLGTATVGLAIPIYKASHALRNRWFPLVLATLLGGAVSIGSAVLLGHWLALPDDIILGFWTKSITAPIAMGLAEQFGGSPTLAAIFTMITGIVGAVTATFLFNTLQNRTWWQRGFSIGLAAHGLGTSRAFSVSAEAGAYASLAMGLHGVLGAALLPWVYRWVHGLP